jgi:hypothetical protein
VPTNAFIIRPFGKKPVIRSSQGHDRFDLQAGTNTVHVDFVDFDAVERTLIAPALKHFEIGGRTTVEIMAAGNIREDMFHRLLTADLVIADVSIHNANAFYELGLRHAFRGKYTLLVRSDSSDYPFDLQTDRYFTYDQTRPAESLPGLIEALRQTLNSDSDDSPVYKLIPNLQAQDRSRFLAPPRDFCEAVERAKRGERQSDLRLLAAEAEGFIWEIEGLREVGRAQTDLNLYVAAKVTWEALQRRYPDDLEANMMLSSLYERLYEQHPDQDLLTRSEQFLQRVLDQKGLSQDRRSEVLALIGLQHRAGWRKRWVNVEPIEERRKQALRSHYLREARRNYLAAFYENLNNYHAGLNALALFKIEEQLANAHRDVWDELHDDPDRELQELTAQGFRLMVAVELSLEAEKRRFGQERDLRARYWREINEAIFFCITTTQRTHKFRVAKEFEQAFSLAPPASIASVRELLEDYKNLGVFTDNVNVAIASAAVKTALSPPGKDTLRILLFAGQRIDQDRDATGVSVSPDRIEKARDAIRQVVLSEQKRAEQILFGMASAANSAEILFHEVCLELNIPTRLYLPMPVEPFVGRYVSPLDDQDDEWVERFNKLYRECQRRYVLSDSGELPRWLQVKRYYSMRRRGNVWMLQQALVEGEETGAQISLIALWDGHEDEVAGGGISDLVSRAKSSRAKYLPINTKRLFGT